ncbi:transmembrane protein 135-like [Agrilus planipennis]|nr:transmembrane protein 135-like [Agrilus planipennis]XP_025832026.1 transmembrane protein 135-like [Agrilus planipennis]
MVQVLSKLATTKVSCIEYVHPWTNSCLEASCGVYLYSIMSSFKIYLTVYMLGLVLGGKVPSLKRLQKTFKSILQSTAFLSGTALGYSLFLCSLRKIFGGYNILTVSAFPAFLSSVFAIQIEKPHRRLLLSLYVSNVATETLWNMASARNLVKSIKYGEVAIFSLAMCILLMYFKGGHHKKLEDGGQPDRIFSILG